jgi:hypothetical protein
LFQQEIHYGQDMDGVSVVGEGGIFLVVDHQQVIAVKLVCSLEERVDLALACLRRGEVVGDLDELDDLLSADQDEIDLATVFPIIYLIVSGFSVVVEFEEYEVFQPPAKIVAVLGQFGEVGDDAEVNRAKQIILYDFCSV